MSKMAKIQTTNVDNKIQTTNVDNKIQTTNVDNNLTTVGLFMSSSIGQQFVLIFGNCIFVLCLWLSDMIAQSPFGKMAVVCDVARSCVVIVGLANIINFLNILRYNQEMRQVAIIIVSYKVLLLLVKHTGWFDENKLSVFPWY